MAQPNIFVSHSHDDDAFAERLVADLRAAGANAWLDKMDLGAGNFQQRINEALARCDWFVLVQTRSALASSWVQQEVDAANRLKHQRRIRDLMFIQAGPIEHRELPALWGVYNIFDATADYASACEHVLTAVGIADQETDVAVSSLDVVYPWANAPLRSSDWVVHILQMGHFVEALDECEKLLTRYPNDAAMWHLKARALSALGRTSEAQKAEEISAVLKGR